MPIPLRARLDVDERRAQLLRLGLELFGARSYDTISIDDISALAKISRGLLYHYFRNKRGFYVETIRFAAEQLRERIQPDPNLPPLERLEQGLNGYLDYVSNYAQAYTTLLRGGIGMDEEVAAIIEATRDAIIADMVEGLGASGKDPLLRVALRGWLGMVEFASLEWLSERAKVSRERLIEVLIAACEATVATVGPRE